MTRAVVLDRDGTLIEEVGYLNRLDRIRFFPYSVDAVRLLNRAGFTVVVATNQSGVARGFFDEAFVEDTHRYLSETLATGGARIDGFYYCPHHPDAVLATYRRQCDCRKPGPGMLRQAAADHRVDLPRSFVVGDSAHDLQAASAVGARGVLVGTGHTRTDAWAGGAAGVVVGNLMEAVSWILRQP